MNDIQIAAGLAGLAALLFVAAVIRSAHERQYRVLVGQPEWLIHTSVGRRRGGGALKKVARRCISPGARRVSKAPVSQEGDEGYSPLVPRALQDPFTRLVTARAAIVSALRSAHSFMADALRRAQRREPRRFAQAPR